MIPLPLWTFVVSIGGGDGGGGGGGGGWNGKKDALAMRTNLLYYIGL